MGTVVGGGAGALIGLGAILTGGGSFATAFPIAMLNM